MGVGKLFGLACRRPVVSGVLLALLIEAVTVFNRFVLGLRAVDFAHLHTWATSGFRLHHGYPGLALLVVWLVTALVRSLRGSPWRGGFLIVGIGLALSDAVHHFVVLKLVTGSAEFP